MVGEREYQGHDAAGFTAWLKDFLPEAKAYRNPRVGMIVLFDNFAGEKYLQNHIFFSFDGTRFQQAEEHRSSSTSSGDYLRLDSSIEAVFEKDKTVEKARLLFEYDMLTLITGLEDSKFTAHTEFAQFSLMEDYNLKNATFAPLPNVRKPEYLFQMSDGSYIYVDAARYNYSYESFRFFIGTPGSMAQLPITSVNRYRDGGTTIIRTEKGILYSPTIFESDKKPVWSTDTKLKDRDFFEGNYGTADVLIRIDKDQAPFILIAELRIHGRQCSK